MMKRGWDWLWCGVMLAGVGLSGCSSPPKAQPQAMDAYAVAPAGRDMYRIEYRGEESAAPKERILDFALARASHVADAEGYRYFAVIDESKSGEGEIHYYEDDASLRKKATPKTLLVHCFPHRPKRTICFRAGYTANVVYEKYGLNRQAEAE